LSKKLTSLSRWEHNVASRCDKLAARGGNVAVQRMLAKPNQQQYLVKVLEDLYLEEEDDF